MLNLDFIGINNRMKVAEFWNSSLEVSDLKNYQNDYKTHEKLDINRTLLENIVKDGWLPGSELNHDAASIVKWAEGVFLKYAKKKSDELEPKKLKSFMQNICDSSSLNESPLVDFFAQPQILDLLLQYFTTLPVFTSAKLLYTPAKETDSKGYSASQLFHKDTASKKLLKFVFNIRDISEKNGPFSFLDAPTSTVLSNSINYGARGVSYRADDKTAAKFIPENSTRMNIGKAGTYALCDTRRCFHFGARTFEAERLILICTFSMPYRSDFRKKTWPLKACFLSSSHRNNMLLKRVFANN